MNKWYPQLKHVSLKSEILEIDQTIIDGYLLKDGVCQPEKIINYDEDSDSSGDQQPSETEPENKV